MASLKDLNSSSTLLKTNPVEAMARRKVEQRGPSNVLTFPKNIGAHGMLMRFFEYTYGGSKGSEEIPIAEIMLPLPKQLQDSFKINVGSNELGLMGTTAAELASDGLAVGNRISSFASASGDAGAAAGNALMDFATGNAEQKAAAKAKAAAGLNNALDAVGFLAKAGLSKISPDIANGMGVGRGTAVNPFATLVFNGVDLKVHNLEWTLSPESEEEARDLKKIIRTLQRMVLPKVEGVVSKDMDFSVGVLDRGILRYPAMVNVFLLGVDQNYYFKFKTSMVSQLNIDYSPGGISINKGGKPSQIGITMTLNEAQIHTVDDNAPSDILLEDIQEAIDARVVDNLNTNDGEAREFNPNTVRNANNQGFSTNPVGFVGSDEVLVERTVGDNTVTQVLTQTELLNQGFTQAQIDGTDTTGIDTVKFTKGPIS